MDLIDLLLKRFDKDYWTMSSKQLVDLLVKYKLDLPEFRHDDRNIEELVENTTFWEIIDERKSYIIKQLQERNRFASELLN